MTQPAPLAARLAAALAARPAADSVALLPPSPVTDWEWTASALDADGEPLHYRPARAATPEAALAALAALLEG